MQEKYRKYETEELVGMYQSSHHEDILAEIMRRNKGLFYKWGQEYYLVGYDIEDKLSEAYIAMIRAIDTYNEAEGVMFSSYLKTCVKQHYNRIYNSQHRQKRHTEQEPLSWEGLEEIHKEKAIEFELLSDLEVREFISSLDGKVQEIAINLLNGFSKTEIAERLNIKPASVTYHCKRLESMLVNYLGLRGSERLVPAF